ncbi:MAG: SprT-like domain-containing protein [Oscillospiraceae bacterium]
MTAHKNDADALLQAVLSQARAAGIPVSGAIEPQVRINTRATTRFGRCSGSNGRFVIELSARLLDAPEAACRQTLAHELLHTCRGCRNHQALWRSYAARMNAQFGYSIGRVSSCEALGLEPAGPIRYRLRCEGCGAVLTRQRRSPLVEHPERYRCRCGGRLIRLGE